MSKHFKPPPHTCVTTLQLGWSCFLYTGAQQTLTKKFAISPSPRRPLPGLSLPLPPFRRQPCHGNPVKLCVHSTHFQPLEENTQLLIALQKNLSHEYLSDDSVAIKHIKGTAAETVINARSVSS